jgi:hypothetical protein
MPRSFQHVQSLSLPLPEAIELKVSVIEAYLVQHLPEGSVLIRWAIVEKHAKQCKVELSYATTETLPREDP